MTFFSHHFPDSSSSSPLVIDFRKVIFRHDHNVILNELSWEVRKNQHWVILGPNGSGKTTALKLVSGQLHPTSGTVDILGNRLGGVDVRVLRQRIGFVSGAITRSLRAGQIAHDVVLAGKHAAFEAWWNEYTHHDHERVAQLLDDLGVSGVGHREFAVISEGERQQVLLARALMGKPELLLLDEPFAGLDLGARERLLMRMSSLVKDVATPPIVLVTHHVEEIPIGITHAALMRDGRLIASGKLSETLTNENVSKTFGLSVRISFENERWLARSPN